MADLDFFFDPVCPWAWVTSRWVVEVADQRKYDVEWRYICLRIVNEDKAFEQDPTSPYGRVHGAGRMLVLAPGKPVAITGVEKAVVLLLGGEPLGGRFIEWNFVSSSRERIEQAKADWRAGRLKLPDLDDREWIPLPGDPPPPAGP